MRWFALFGILSAVAVPSIAQHNVPLFELSFPQSPNERLDIEIVPVVVISETSASAFYEADDQEGLGELFLSLFSQISDVFGSTHDALHTLGVEPFQYNLHLGSEMHIMICREARLYSEQQCVHEDLGLIEELPDFVHDLHDREAPPRGSVQISIVVLEDEVAWSGVIGRARFWWWGDRFDNHWTRTACRAWALHSVPIIAHELGHCFMLRHNEQDSDSGLDLMLANYTHFDWVKNSNKEIVERHFRHPTPELSISGTMPQTELAY